MLFIMFFSFIFDSQIVLILGNLLPSPFLFSSHLSIIVLMYFENKFSNFSIYLVSFVAGMIIDSYFYHIIGLATFIYPFLVYLIKKHKGLILMGTTRLLMLIVLIFIFEGSTYFLAMIYGLTKYPIDLALTYHFMPTLIFNSFILGIVSSIFKSIT